jgi:hypothetical protein
VDSKLQPLPGQAEEEHVSDRTLPAIEEPEKKKQTNRYKNRLPDISTAAEIERHRYAEGRRSGREWNIYSLF